MQSDKKLKSQQYTEEESDNEKENQNSSDEEQQFHPIEILSEHNISQNDITKLIESGYKSIESVFYQTSKNLSKILSSQKSEKIITICNKILSIGIKPSTIFLEQRKKILKITTGSSELDHLLRGGIEANSITEISGEFRSGKTQICHTLSVTCQLPKSEGGGEGKAIYIDTEGTFRPEKLTPIAKRFGLDPKKTIANVFYARAFNSEHQNKLLFQVCALMAESKFSLLIVDSATALYRTDYNSKNELSARQMSLAKFLRNLQKIADEHKIPVVITNQVIATVNENIFGGCDKKPVGGHIMAHACQTRLFLRKGLKEIRICKIYDSPSLPEDEAKFAITEEGIDDVVE